MLTDDTETETPADDTTPAETETAAATDAASEGLGAARRIGARFAAGGRHMWAGLRHWATTGHQSDEELRRRLVLRQLTAYDAMRETAGEELDDVRKRITRLEHVG